MMLEIPMPPSANRYWRTWRGQTVKSDEARDYQALLRAMYAHVRPMCGFVAVTLDVHLCRGDIDNRLKVTLDALKGIVYLDDKQVRRITMQHFQATTKTERVLVALAEFFPQPPMDERGIIIPLPVAQRPVRAPRFVSFNEAIKELRQMKFTPKPNVVKR